jgi:tetratricopeptide (TPR) repeat protein
LREIESSGAIALCKWSRLMIVSPRALVHGYPWRDTIAHELTHLALSRMTGGRAPMWLHEGVAKFEETRWRSDPPGRLSPMAGLLLDRAVAGNRLIPFRRLHPSIAKLPTQNDAALAFAEVYTFVRYLYGRMDYAGLRSALARVRDGGDAGAALAAAAGPGITFQRLLDGWNEQIARRPNGPPNASAARPQPLRFRRTDGPNGDGGDDSAAAARIERPRLRNLVRLGDILWGAVRPRAAAIEYERAHRLDAHDPIIANRLARSLVVTGQARRVADVLRPTLDLYPEFAPSWSNLGAAQAALQERARAGASYREALGLNPFDPEVHCALSTLARTEGDSAGAARHERACQTLRGRP